MAVDNVRKRIEMVIAIVERGNVVQLAAASVLCRVRTSIDNEQPGAAPSTVALKAHEEISDGSAVRFVSESAIPDNASSGNPTEVGSAFTLHLS